MSIEILESRIAPAALIGNTPGDHGKRSLTLIPALMTPATDVTTLVDNSSSATTTGTLAYAIAYADNHPGSTISFGSTTHPLKGTITLKSALPAISSSVIIDAPGITINGAGEFQDLSITGGPSISITGIKLTNGKAASGSGLYINDSAGTVDVTSCTITKNQAVGAAGDSAGNGLGGGIDVLTGTLDLTASTVSGNSASGGHAAVPATAGTIGPNAGNGLGGGLYVSKGAMVVITSSTISGNKALGGNGTDGAEGANGAKGAGSNAGTAGTAGGTGGRGGNGYGGGINSAGTLTITGSTISGNLALGGNGGEGGVGGKGGVGGTHNIGGNGGAGGNGGYGGSGSGAGIYSHGALIVNTSTISGNATGMSNGGKGGAGGAAGAGTLVQGGHATHASAGQKGGKYGSSYGVGGGIFSTESIISLSQDTVANNSSYGGGGLAITYDTSAMVDNCTIVFNKASGVDGGGGLFTYLDTNNDPVVVTSSAIGQNTSKHVDQDVDGPITANYSLIESNVTSDGAITGANNILGKSPLLGALGDHGGPTQTCLPSAKSPLLNAGSNPNNLTTDQRGDPLGTGQIDIGSVEAG